MASGAVRDSFLLYRVRVHRKLRVVMANKTMRKAVACFCTRHYVFFAACAHCGVDKWLQAAAVAVQVAVEAMPSERLQLHAISPAKALQKLGRAFLCTHPQPPIGEMEW